jgi:RNA 2',3'-cyclic 3'-phosphodiesterase
MNEAKSGKNPEVMIRTFICIDIPHSIKARIEKLQSQLRRPSAQISWVKPANIHLTLRFLGDVAQSKILKVNTAVNRAVDSFGPFQITVGSTGCFPSPRHPSVLWIGISPVAGDLQKLRDAIEVELVRQGFEPENKKFKPHLTIARIRNPRNAAEVTEAFLTSGFADQSFQANEVLVMRSQLSPQGSIYTPQAVIPLKG